MHEWRAYAKTVCSSSVDHPVTPRYCRRHARRCRSSLLCPRGRDPRLRRGRTGLGLRAHRLLRTRRVVGGRDVPSRVVVRRAVARVVHVARLPCGDHRPDRVEHRHDVAAPATGGAGRQAGRRGRPVERWTAAPRCQRRVAASRDAGRRCRSVDSRCTRSRNRSRRCACCGRRTSSPITASTSCSTRSRCTRDPARSIPIWMGGGNFDTAGMPRDVTIKRAARLADGFKMMAPLGTDLDGMLRLVDRLRAEVTSAGRDVGDVRYRGPLGHPRHATRAVGGHGFAPSARPASRTSASPIASSPAQSPIRSRSITRVADATRAEWGEA